MMLGTLPLFILSPSLLLQDLDLTTSTCSKQSHQLATMEGAWRAQQQQLAEVQRLAGAAVDEARARASDAEQRAFNMEQHVSERGL